MGVPSVRGKDGRLPIVKSCDRRERCTDREMALTVRERGTSRGPRKPEGILGVCRKMGRKGWKDGERKSYNILDGGIGEHKRQRDCQTRGNLDSRPEVII